VRSDEYLSYGIIEISVTADAVVLNVLSRGNCSLEKPVTGLGYQALFTREIKKAVGNRLLVSSVGSIETRELAEEIITEGGKGDKSVPLHLIAASRVFQKYPGLVWA
jgi:2,4-dienoyl-CoA reductase-like NADH-dependent reductase (Old Yellow Enzyme family)